MTVEKAASIAAFLFLVVQEWLTKFIDNLEQAAGAPRGCSDMHLYSSLSYPAHLSLEAEDQSTLLLQTFMKPVIQLYDPVPRHPIGIVHLANRHIGSAAQAFMALCRSTIKEMKLDVEIHKKGRAEGFD